MYDMILIGLGSNLTTEKYTSSKMILEAALEALKCCDVLPIKCSQFYETEPVPKSDQPWFVNAVVSVQTNLPPLDLLKVLHDIEGDLGRVRRERWEARIIDLDLISYNDVIIPNLESWPKGASDLLTSDVVIPHARLHERTFVLEPISDIAPDWIHPVLEKNIKTMINEQNSDAIVRLL